MSGSPRKTHQYFKNLFNAIVNDYVIIACKMLFKITSDLKMLTHIYTYGNAYRLILETACYSLDSQHPYYSRFCVFYYTR